MITNNIKLTGFGEVDHEMEAIIRFHEKFGMLRNDTPLHLTKRKLRERGSFMQEELDEFHDAVERQNLPDIIDALMDIVYVAKGTAAYLGARYIWVAGFYEVHRANMEKETKTGRRGWKEEIVKPDGWIPPRHDQILEDAGYRRSDWTRPEEIDERRCVDDDRAVEDPNQQSLPLGPSA